MSRPRKIKKKPNGTWPRRPRPYHLVDDDAHAFESGENPDWLVGAY